ncbi:putative 26S proteasome regulatory subunit 10B, partial [Mucuna pruriens]
MQGKLNDVVLHCTIYSITPSARTYLVNCRSNVHKDNLIAGARVCLHWEMFRYARDHQPCIIFMNEIDAIGGRRLSGGTSADREIVQQVQILASQLEGILDLIGSCILSFVNGEEEGDATIRFREEREKLIRRDRFVQWSHVTHSSV